MYVAASTCHKFFNESQPVDHRYDDVLDVDVSVQVSTRLQEAVESVQLVLVRKNLKMKMFKK